MDLDLVMELIAENGYLGLFFWLWLGVFGVPLPNEVIVMGVGFASSIEVFHPLLAFAVTYTGIIFALTTSYLLGRLVGKRILEILKKNKQFSKSLESSFRLMEKYHAFSLSFSYFIPGVRNFIPFLYGMGGLRFRTFALFSYSGSLTWLLVVFSLGFLFGDNMDRLLKFGGESGVILLGVALLTAAVLVFRRKRRSGSRVLDR
ncbi:DedA family protein [Mesobacillus zeae]|uniref:DedA family protein n=1 Tax=Mesobacillus zeae TaxID=1917180 RepID=A0A398BNC4_9BACI|nr:DedA family protein [Mesobacillus zeae]RID88856.1 DedA family protein [Mesobacillus zeae]